MAARHRKSETVLRAGPEVSVEGVLAGLPGMTVETVAGERVRTVHHDADDHVLTRLGVGLCRRSGGRDDGWELTVPSGEAGVEHHRPVDGSEPPADLRWLVEGALGARWLSAVAAIDTVRRHHVVRDAGGGVVLEVAEDAVSADRIGDGEADLGLAWSQLGVELGPAGTEKDLRRAIKRLRRAGAETAAPPTEPPTTLHEVLGLGSAEVEDDALSAYLRAQCRRVLLGEIDLRHEAGAGAVHRTRVGVRRLRSVVRVFGDLLAPGPARLSGIDADLRWFAGLLGDVRDADVLREDVLQAVRGLPRELVLGPVTQEVETALAEDRERALRRWKESLSGVRYLDTLRLLGDWLAAPPVRAGLDDQTLRRDGWALVKKARRKLERRLARSGDDVEETHRARKAAKRLRYAATVLQPLRPKAGRAKKRARTVQRTLGRHQDLVVSMRFFRAQAARYGAQEGHNGFTYGALHGAARAEAARIREELR